MGDDKRSEFAKISNLTDFLLTLAKQNLVTDPF